jgi:hypothetical protein
VIPLAQEKVNQKMKLFERRLLPPTVLSLQKLKLLQLILKVQQQLLQR